MCGFVCVCARARKCICCLLEYIDHIANGYLCIDHMRKNIPKNQLHDGYMVNRFQKTTAISSIDFQKTTAILSIDFQRTTATARECNGYMVNINIPRKTTAKRIFLHKSLVKIKMELIHVTAFTRKQRQTDTHTRTHTHTHTHTVYRET